MKNVNRSRSLMLATAVVVIAAVAVPLSAQEPAGASSALPLSVGLQCEHQANPLGVDRPQPALSWMLEGQGRRGLAQSAYRVLVASTSELLAADTGDLWDSGKVSSRESCYQIYGGKALASRQRCFWKVKIWDQQQHESPWSDPAEWTMGILDGTPWQAKWIGAPNTAAPEAAHYFRHEVKLDKPLRRALVRFAGLGFVDVLINGVKPDEREMIGPRFANPKFRIIYSTVDVTRLLREGDNCLGAILANGYNSPPSKGWSRWQRTLWSKQFMLELDVEFADGSRTFVGSDERWQSGPGPIVHQDFWIKEVHDLRLEQEGWAKVGFGGAWGPVAVAAKSADGKMCARRNPAVRRHASVKALQREGNTYIFDRVYTGFPRVKVQGKAGDTVTIKGDPKLGWTQRGHSFGPFQVEFILRDEKEVVLSPRFTAHTIGPRFTIEGLAQLPPAEDVSIETVHADLRDTGSFLSSNELFNELHAIGRHTHLNYVLHYPNDPTREKSGWSQDFHSMFESACYLNDMATLYEQWWQDYADDQRPDGRVASVAPTNVGRVDCLNDPWWGGMIIYAPWRHYEFYGDKRILENAYAPMRLYFNWLKGMFDEKTGYLAWAGASDWIEVGAGYSPPKRTPKFLVSTMAYIHYTDILARVARLLGHTDQAAEYEALAVKIRETFNQHHFDPETGIYSKATDSQAALIMPLAFKVVPKGKEALVLQRLEENIKLRKDHLSTGFVSNPILLHGLTDLGRADLAGKVTNQRDYPSFYSTAKHGVFMETWNGGMVQMPSLAGSCVGWLYRAVLGIRSIDPGFKTFMIKPERVGDVTWAKGHTDTPYGRIESNWKCEGGAFQLDVSIPANTTATVYVPAKEGEGVRESGKPAAEAEGIKFVKVENGRSIFTVQSGSYRFSVGK